MINNVALRRKIFGVSISAASKSGSLIQLEAFRATRRLQQLSAIRQSFTEWYNVASRVVAQNVRFGG